MLSTHAGPGGVARPVILDGGMSNALEDRGHDLGDALWSARLLRDAPDEVAAVHRAYFAAGAQVATTASYQASREGFATAGVAAAEADALLRQSVALARQAQQEAGVEDRSWVAASVGPYGAVLADGSEYTGAYAGPGRMSASDLEAFHRPRLEVLTAAGPDVLACETLPALAEVEALVRALPGVGVPAWLSLTTVVDAEGVVRTRLGEPASEAFAMARDSDQVLAVGVNCLDPADVLPAVREAAQVSGKPVVVYPNSGETWDAATRSWNGDADLRLEDVSAWLDAGTRLVGGCCRVLPSHVRRVSQLLRPEPGQP